MCEVVVQISSTGADNAYRLTRALDAFAKWTEESGQANEGQDAPDIMMMTEHLGGQVRRRLVFQDREYAARFLLFWRSERSRASREESVVVLA